MERLSACGTAEAWYLLILCILFFNFAFLDLIVDGDDEDNSFPVLSTMILLRKPRILARIQYTGWSDPDLRKSTRILFAPQAINVSHA